MGETLRDRRLRYARAILESKSSSTALLGENAGLDGLRVLVLGAAPSETLCALMHTECRKAEARLPDASCEINSADLVLVPHVTLITLGRVARQAARALERHGRIVMANPGGERDFIGSASRELVQAGFEMPILQSRDGLICLHASPVEGLRSH
ncbi:hypothetical protein [Lichenicoccus roseus]|uniref:Uncharacterized protein n=1 Tax=Lichenicoccus roseus TaxID=2683649 RepID=A0A5R9J3H6_9PROT|nr:hypothetical protein [Lichenicoccus roseus]TLU71529.1 hypothetical protein FE263_16745 [Lichenicoccus roseus]